MDISSKLNWRVWLGLGLTLLWLVITLFYISGQVGWSVLFNLPANAMGAFLDGIFAPLAFLWLVIGYFLQKLELEQTTSALNEQAREIRRSAEQAAFQSEKMAQGEIHARQQAFLAISEHVRAQLGGISGLLFVSSQGESGAGTISVEQEREMFATMTTSDSQLFARRLLELHRSFANHEDKYTLFYGTNIRARHSNNYIFTFERLIGRARSMDTDHMISEALSTDAHGLLYVHVKRHQRNAPFALRVGRSSLRDLYTAL